MVALKAGEAQSFSRTVPRKYSVFLFHGTDPGLVAELARQTAETLAKRESPPSEILRIEDADLENDPDRLIVELNTMPMFGGGKVVRTTTGRRVNGPMLATLIEDGPPSASLVVEAGSLKASDALRKAFEKAPFAAAVACYADSSDSLEALASQMLREAGIVADPAVTESLVARLGADRGLSRQEIEKLILYAGPGATLTQADVEAIVGDAAEQTLDRVADAVAEGRGSVAVIEHDRAVASGQTPQGVLLAVERHFLMLSRLSALVAGGKPAREAMRQLRPPLHFSRQDAMATHCRIWHEAALTSAIQRIAAALKAARVGEMPEALIVERVLMELAAQAKALTQGRNSSRR
ncbi:MAG: DNA polymerase III subunit delta [Hyphomicrobiaceae bacterium]